MVSNAFNGEFHTSLLRWWWVPLHPLFRFLFLVIIVNKKIHTALHKNDYRGAAWSKYNEVPLYARKIVDKEPILNLKACRNIYQEIVKSLVSCFSYAVIIFILLFIITLL